MTTKEYDFLVFIGRFQPFHKGHLAVINEGLRKAEQIIVLCGSAHQPRSFRNPWTVTERASMIFTTLSLPDQQRTHVAPLMDSVYNDESWVKNVQTTIKGITTAHHSQPHKPPKIGLIGHCKDQSSYYLNLFPQWSSVNVEDYQGISASSIRHSIFSNSMDDANRILEPVKDQLATIQYQCMIDFCNSPAYLELKKEHQFIVHYKKAWQLAPYEPTFVTVDAVVVQSGHILMVERKARPGKGLMALPGGFVDQGEKLIDACLRELREETRLKVPTPVLKGSIQGQRMFDDPHRSARGRTITQAYYIALEPSKDLPKVKGGDDAKVAAWVPLADLDPTHIYEDHYFIIQELIGM